MASALAFALAPVTEAYPCPDRGCGEQLPVITIHSAGNVLRGKTGSFVLKMTSSASLSGTYVNFKVSGTAVQGVDYAPLISPALIGASGYGVISLRTLADPRAADPNPAYSVVVTLEAGPGYAVGQPNSATIWITNSCALEACW